MTGYDRRLYVLPFDHRGSFQKGLFGISGTPTPEQTAQIASFKAVIYEGFKLALGMGVPQDRAGILVDEQFGADIARDAVRRGYTLAMPAEKSGQDEFDFEYGDRFGEHIEAFRPTFCKVLVRYNPDGDGGLNRRQAERLALLGRWLAEHGYLYMFELLVPPTPAQLESVGGDRSRYDEELRPKLMVRAIAELQGAGVSPDVWKIEGITNREDCAAVAQQARSDGRERVGCIVLGRGEDEGKVVAWLTTAAQVEGWIGFAVGRTTFWGPLVDLKEGRAAPQEAARRIAQNYKRFVDLWEASAPVAGG